jgi:hypothetical protein
LHVQLPSKSIITRRLTAQAILLCLDANVKDPAAYVHPGLANPTIHRQAPLDTKTSNRKEANTHIMKPAIKARRAADAFNLSSTVQAHPEQDGGR